MAYMNQELKARISPAVKAICNKYGIKGTLAIRNHSTLVLNIKSGKIDFIENTNRVRSTNFYQVLHGFTPAKNFIQLNPYHFEKHFDGDARNFFSEVLAAMNVGNHDNSDIMTDYFDVGWYVNINIGSWNKPYKVIK